jgi:hypothetical protein
MGLILIVTFAHLLCRRDVVKSFYPQREGPLAIKREPDVRAEFPPLAEDDRFSGPQFPFPDIEIVPPL